VDFSASARQDLPLYQQQLGTILKEMPPNSRLVVGKITDRTEQTFDPFIDFLFPSEDFFFSVPDEVQEKKDSLAARFQRVCQETFAAPTLSRETDILSGLGLVNVAFPSSSRRVLVLLSDMLHCAEDFDLERADVTESYIETTIGRLKDRDLIPQLGGVEVYVAGARASTQERYHAVRKFWLRLLAQTGAQVRSYGHTLLNFRLRSAKKRL
jgi:hypothetical protein